MENPVWNFSAKGASVIAVLLLVAAGALTLAGLTGVRTSGTFDLVFVLISAASAIYALVASQRENSRSRKIYMAAVETADLLSSGKPIDGRDDDELMAKLADISAYLDEKANLIGRLSRGEEARLVFRRDDNDRLGRSLEQLNVQLVELGAIANGRKQFEDSLIRLLQRSAGAGAVDFSMPAEAGPEFDGPIAEAFNSMSGNLRAYIRQARQVTGQVAESAGSIQETTEQLSRGSVIQASQISRTTTAISKIAAQIYEVSQNAELSSQVAADSLARARTGTKAAAENLNAMMCVRRQVQETSKRVKRLGERSQEIGQIVELIEDLSDRTSLLALNATLQAAAAGDAGEAFAPIAEEVERLAERSNRLTRQIAALTQSINTETQEVVTAMEDTVHEVVLGSALAEKAGKALFAIESTSARLAELLTSISDAAKYQAKSSEDISNAMAAISEVTEIVETASQRASESVRALVRLADEMQNSTPRFDLPSAASPVMNVSAEKDQFVY